MSDNASGSPLTVALSGLGGTPLQIITTSVPSIASGQAYSQVLAASGGNGDYTWSLSSGSLPKGFTLSAEILFRRYRKFGKSGGRAELLQFHGSGHGLRRQSRNAATHPGHWLSRGCVVERCVSEYDCHVYCPKFDDAHLDYAADCGFASFNWQQQVTTLPGPNNFTPGDRTLINPKNIASDGSLTAPPAFYDPPPGSYAYQIALNAGYNPYPFYDPPSYLAPGFACTLPKGASSCPIFPYIVSADGTTLVFLDDPADPYLTGVPADTFPADGSSWRSRHPSSVYLASNPRECELRHRSIFTAFLSSRGLGIPPSMGQRGGVSQTDSIYPGVRSRRSRAV